MKKERKDFRPGIEPSTQRLGVQYTRHQAITQDKSLSFLSFFTCVNRVILTIPSPGELRLPNNIMFLEIGQCPISRVSSEIHKTKNEQSLQSVTLISISVVHGSQLPSLNYFMNIQYCTFCLEVP